MNRFTFEQTSDCPQGEYVLIADPRFRVEVQDDGTYVVLEVSPPVSSFFKMTHHGRHTQLPLALEEAATRAVPIRPRKPWRKN